MTDSVLLIEKNEGIVTLTLNRPHAMNALSHELRQAIVQTFVALQNDPETRVVILTGAGKAFVLDSISKNWDKQGYLRSARAARSVVKMILSRRCHSLTVRLLVRLTVLLLLGVLSWHWR